MKIALQLVVWNGEKYLPFLLSSLQKQTIDQFDLFILDNDSQDNSLSICKKYQAKDNQLVQVISQDTNLGFAGGHNVLFEMTADYEYVLLVNQDLVFDVDCLKKLVSYMDQHKNVGALSPRLMKWKDLSDIPHSSGQIFQKSERIDSLGVKKNTNWSFEEIGNGNIWKETNEISKEVECVSGTAPLYRRLVLDKIQYSKKEVFDGMFTIYKEDIDLGLRITSAGYQNHTLFAAVAHHDRTVSQTGNSVKAIFRNKKSQSKYVRLHSYKNHIMILCKYFKYTNFIALLSVIWYEIRKAIFYLGTEPTIVLSAWWFIVKNIKEIFNKRKPIQQK